MLLLECDAVRVVHVPSHSRTHNANAYATHSTITTTKSSTSQFNDAEDNIISRDDDTNEGDADGKIYIACNLSNNRSESQRWERKKWMKQYRTVKIKTSYLHVYCWKSYEFEYTLRACERHQCQRNTWIIFTFRELQDFASKILFFSACACDSCHPMIQRLHISTSLTFRFMENSLRLRHFRRNWDLLIPAVVDCCRFFVFEKEQNE